MQDPSTLLVGLRTSNVIHFYRIIRIDKAWLAICACELCIYSMTVDYKASGEVIGW